MDELNISQYRALCGLASGMTISEAAQIAGVSASSIDKWKRQPEFQKQLRESINRVFEASQARLVLGAQEAVDELRQIINDSDVSAKTRLSAINILLTQASKCRDFLLEQRLERIESLIENESIKIAKA